MGKSKADFRGADASGDEPTGAMDDQKNKKDVGAKGEISGKTLKDEDPSRCSGIGNDYECGRDLKRENQAEEKKCRKD